jgi:DsbC/DsbD-like thiol-disulfide interchange protein
VLREGKRLGRFRECIKGGQFERKKNGHDFLEGYIIAQRFGEETCVPFTISLRLQTSRSRDEEKVDLQLVLTVRRRLEQNPKRKMCPDLAISVATIRILNQYQKSNVYHSITKVTLLLSSHI